MSFHRVMFSSGGVDWGTPRDLYEGLDKLFRFDFDPCPMGGESKCDGLLVSWSGRRVFCNPPYGRETAAWLGKAWEAVLAVYLLPARTDTKWFHEIVLPDASDVIFVKGRLTFGDAEHVAPFPSMVVVFNSFRVGAGRVFSAT